MKGFLVVFLSVVGAVLTEDCFNEFPEVTAPAGRVRGSIIKSRLGRNIFSFRGIRYGEPPTGERRFQVAAPVTRWNGVFDATEESPSCPRPGGELMSEDCLRLNVYTTKLPSNNNENVTDVKRPVIIFFHPGGFYGFSGQSYLFGPNYLLDKDIVLVTANYRLGTLGFISTGDASAPGNLGLKDQVVVLKWVQKNIAAFGGDRNSVTLTGYSAGSQSNILHMLSPMSKGLFHRVIAMSSSPVKKDPLPTQQRHLAVKQAELLGCPTDSNARIIECLRTKPVEDYVKTVKNFFEWWGFPILVWSPVVEPEIPGEERFLTDQPARLIKQGKIVNQVPLITGVTRDEFGGLVVPIKEALLQGNDSIVRELNENWDTLAPILFAYERDTPKSNEISNELRRFYLNGKPVGLDNIDGLARLFADSITIFPMHRMAKLMAEYSKAPVYFYKFTYEGRYSFATYSDGRPFGVAHHDDLQYLFYMSFKFPLTNTTGPEVPMLERLTSIWSSFASTDEPIPKNDDAFKNVQWERYSSARDNYLEINLNPSMKTGVYPDRMEELEKLFPLSAIMQSQPNAQ